LEGGKSPENRRNLPQPHKKANEELTPTRTTKTDRGKKVLKRPQGQPKKKKRSWGNQISFATNPQLLWRERKSKRGKAKNQPRHNPGTGASSKWPFLKHSKSFKERGKRGKHKDDTKQEKKKEPTEIFPGKAVGPRKRKDIKKTKPKRVQKERKPWVGKRTSQGCRNNPRKKI